jgi:hypothetical protein
MKIAQRFIAGIGMDADVESVQRTADSKYCSPGICSVVRLTDSIDLPALPSAKALGYYHSVRFADGREDTFAAKPPDSVFFAGRRIAN